VETKGRGVGSQKKSDFRGGTGGEKNGKGKEEKPSRSDVRVYLSKNRDKTHGTSEMRSGNVLLKRFERPNKRHNGRGGGGQK